MGAQTTRVALTASANSNTRCARGGCGAAPQLCNDSRVSFSASLGQRRRVSRQLMTALAAVIILAGGNIAFGASGGESIGGGGPETSRSAPPPCPNSMGKDDTIGGRTGPPGTPMINSRQTHTPDIATNPPCGPK